MSSFGLMYKQSAFERWTYAGSAHGGNSRLSHLGNPHLSYSDTIDILHKEVYNRLGIFYNQTIGQRWQINARLDLADNYYLQNDSVAANIAGIGDVRIMGRYRIMGTSVIEGDSVEKPSFLHRLIGGAGIRIPTGHYNKRSHIGNEIDIVNGQFVSVPKYTLEEEMQPGVGAFEFMLNADYMCMWKYFGIFQDANYMISTVNGNDFRFANRFFGNTSLFAVIKAGPVQLFPYWGAYYEAGGQHVRNISIVENSGGEAVLLSTGLRLYVKDVLFQAGFQRPVYERLPGLQPLNKNRWELQLAYFIGRST